jgi:hypothetical protein
MTVNAAARDQPKTCGIPERLPHLHPCPRGYGIEPPEGTGRGQGRADEHTDGVEVSRVHEPSVWTGERVFQQGWECPGDGSAVKWE